MSHEIKDTDDRPFILTSEHVKCIDVKTEYEGETVTLSFVSKKHDGGAITFTCSAAAVLNALLGHAQWEGL